MQKSGSLRVWVEGTIIAAVAMILSFIPISLGYSFSISLGTIPLTLYAFRRGWKAGVFAGFIWGILHFPMGQVAFLSVSQVLIEYLFAFSFAGFAGIYSGKIRQALARKEKAKLLQNIILGVTIGIVARYFWHFVAGVIFWGEYAMWGMGPFWFSLLMNGVSGIATGVVTAVVLVSIGLNWPKLLQPR